jgi:hypothetical protein
LDGYDGKDGKEEAQKMVQSVASRARTCKSKGKAKKLPLHFRALTYVLS